MECKVEGLGSGVWDIEYKIRGLWFGVWSMEFRIDKRER